MSVSYTHLVYDVHFPSVSDAALPQETFSETETLWVNNDQVDLVHTPDAHTDSDIFVRFDRGNVIHTGDLWFNGMYPLIDTGSGGTINGMIRGVCLLYTSWIGSAMRCARRWRARGMRRLRT